MRSSARIAEMRMPEIRKDYATPTWVVFSAARSQRPGAFRNAKDTTPKESCPFCEGHETMTPPEVLAYRDGGKPDGPGWSIRCVPNKFPALERAGEVREHRNCMRQADGKDIWGTGVYREIASLNRIVYTASFPDVKANV